MYEAVPMCSPPSGRGRKKIRSSENGLRSIVHLTTVCPTFFTIAYLPVMSTLAEQPSRVMIGVLRHTFHSQNRRKFQASESDNHRDLSRRLYTCQDTGNGMWNAET